MRKSMILLMFMVSGSVVADRISLSENEKAKEAVMQLEFVQEQIEKISQLSNGDAKLIWITSQEIGIREELEIDEEYNSGMRHKFIFENDDASLACRFSIYVVYQHTVPLSINTELSKVSSEASCTEYLSD